MLVEYKFTAFPQRAVVLSLTDGERQLSVKQPLEDVSANDWKWLGDNGFDSGQCPSPSIMRTMDKLRLAVEILKDSMSRLRQSESAVESGVGLLEYARRPSAGRTMAGKYATAVNRFAAFLAERGEEDIALFGVDVNVVRAFDDFLAREGVRPATVRFYNNIFRAVYNRAVKEGLVGRDNPFGHETVGVGVASASVRDDDLTAGDVAVIREADLSDEPRLAMARDVLMIARLTGLHLGEIAGIRRADIREDGLHTAAGIVALDSEARRLLSRYDTDGYLFYGDDCFGKRERTLKRIRKLQDTYQTALSARLGFGKSITIVKMRRFRMTDSTV